MAPTVIELEEGGYDITINGVSVVRATRLRDAILMYGVALYVLNIKCRSLNRNVMWFITNKIFKIPDEGKAHVSVIKDIERVCSGK